MKDRLQSLASLSGPFPPFDLDAACDAPCDLFSIWLHEAIEAGVNEPHSMVLSTVDEGGGPDARVLILKNLDHRGWHFATTDAGPKGRQIAANLYVALTFYWQPLGRQVRIRGIALPAPLAERDRDFRRRSAAARAVALVGRQSEILSSRRELDLAVETQARRIAETPDIVAPNWSVFMVMSHEVEFWQGNPDRLHQRLRYRKAKSGWLKEPLWP